MSQEANSGGIDRRGVISSGIAAGVAATLPGAATALPGPFRGKEAVGRRRLGALEVSAIGIGVQNMSRTYQGTVPDRAEMVRLLRAVHDRGVGFYDTAEAYGPFECERILGEAVAPFRNQVTVCSKFGWDIDYATGRMTGGLNSRPAHVRRVVEASLQRLRTDRIDLLYQHRVDPAVPIEDVAGVVGDLMKEGKVVHWGLCEAGAQTMRRAHAEKPLSAVQCEYSMLWRGPEEWVLPLCEELGIGFVPFEPLGAGFLTGKIAADARFGPGDTRGIFPRLAPENIAHNHELVRVVSRWAARKGCTPAQLTLAWLMAQKPWIVPIPGTTQLPHFIENVAAVGVHLTAAELTELTAAVSAIPIRGARLIPRILALSYVDAPPRA